MDAKDWSGISGPRRMATQDATSVFYSYEGLNQVKPGETMRMRNLDYIIFVSKEKGESVFAFISKKSYDEQQNNDFGWKFHISVDDHDPKNVAKAWDEVKDVLIKHQITTAKVIRAGFKLESLAANQRGKQITIYQFRDPDLDWQKILTEITQALKVNNIKPGHAPPSDHPIPGSNYVYYRNDRSPTGDYLKGSDKPGEKNATFDAFKIAINDQLPVKEWKAPQQKAAPTTPTLKDK